MGAAPPTSHQDGGYATMNAEGERADDFWDISHNIFHGEPK